MNGTSYTVTGLSKGTAYTFEVRAVNDVGESDSASVTATTLSTAPDPPTGLTVAPTVPDGLDTGFTLTTIPSTG